MQFTKTRPYHDATNNTRRLIFSIFFPWISQKTARYHDATKNTRHLIFLRYLPWKSPNRLSTMMRQMKDFICIFHVFFPTKFIKTAQYHDATHDVPHLNVFTVFCIKSGKAARYHDATNDARHLKFSCFFSMRSSKHIRTVANDTRHLMFSRYFQWKSPKRLSTTLLQMTDFICIFHRIPHEINHNGSVPRCYN